MAVDTSINIPQIVAVVVVGFLAIRWYMSKPPTTSGHPASSSFRNRVDPAKVDAVSAVFPQLDRRSIAWDLQRNGGNVEATTARVLDGRGLDNPPPTFRPELPTMPATATAATGGRSGNGGKAQTQDLITRYGLQGKVGNGKGKEPMPSEEELAKQKKNAWSADKVQRAEALKRRREEMILAARRKMAEKDEA